MKKNEVSRIGIFSEIIEKRNNDRRIKVTPAPGISGKTLLFTGRMISRFLFSLMAIIAPTFLGLFVIMVGSAVSSQDCTITYQESKDFYSVQGFRGWRYLDSNGQEMTYDSVNGRWQGQETYNLIWPGGVHPGNNSDVVLRWVAPAQGTIQISGNVHDGNVGCGTDGVSVTIKHDSSVIWGPIIINKDDAVGQNFNFSRSVSLGNKIDFVVNKLVDNGCDSTALDPTIVLTTSKQSKLYGTHSALEWMNYSDAELAAFITKIKTLGVKISRNGFIWSHIEPVKGQRDWTYMDKVVDSLVANGIEPLMVISGSPEWANGARNAGIDCNTYSFCCLSYVPTAEEQFTVWLNEYRTFVSDLVARYKGQVKHWELWNEPNIFQFWIPQPSAAQYSRWASAIQGVIKAADPSAQVAVGSVTVLDVGYNDTTQYCPPLTTPPQIAGKDFITGIYQSGFYPDIISLHPYAIGGWPADQYTAGDGLNTFKDVVTIRQIMDNFGQSDKPIWLTEYSWRVGDPSYMTEQLQAANLQRSLEIIQFEWPSVDTALWFWDVDRSSDYTGFGLIRTDGTVRDAGKFFKEFVSSACVDDCSDKRVRIAGATPVYYSSLQAAYNAAANNDTIQTLAGTLTENVTINRNISVTLQGGYDCGYATNSGSVTNLKGMLQTVSGGGTLTIGNIVLIQ